MMSRDIQKRFDNILQEVVSELDQSLIKLGSHRFDDEVEAYIEPDYDDEEIDEALKEAIGDIAKGLFADTI